MTKAETHFTQEPEKLDLRSHDIAAEKMDALRATFPEIFTEGNKIDFERLKLALGESVDVGKERYGMNWPGKAECFRTIQQPSLATLRPCPEESVNWETTENLIIEGDNLEVLKLLQKAYLGKVKMIYIDPPYNTGNDFIYPDNYTESLQTYLEYTGQVDSQGKKFSTNTETDGRFHTKWINMMYPRLYLARNLLRDDGIIFVSIDDKEHPNLRKILDDIFGEENFCGMFVWEKKKKPSFLNANMGVVTEYIVVYAKQRSLSPPFVAGKAEEGKKYPFNNAGNPLGKLIFPPASVHFGLPNQLITPQDMSEGNIITKLLTPVEIKDGRNIKEFILEGEWRYSQQKLDEFIRDGDEIYIAKLPFRPNYISQENKDKKCKNLLSIESGLAATYEDATAEIRELFGREVMDYPKPSGLLKFLIETVVHENGLVLDFFAGSGTTAHAVLDLNRKDGGNRKFIMVQLPEPCDGDSEAFKAGFRNIAEICKDRSRRVINKLKSEENGKLPPHGDKQEDLGFKVFKLAGSNFKPWEAQIDRDSKVLSRQLELHIDHINTGRTDADILYEILLKSGFPLASQVEKITLANKAVYSVANGELFLCLDRKLTLELIRAMADRKPERVVCLDEGFAGNDQLKANAAQIFKTRNIVFKTV